MKDGVTDDELARAKNALRVAFYTRLESNSGIRESLAQAESSGTYRDLLDSPKKVEAVTREDVQRVAQKYLVKESRSVLLTTRKGGGGEGMPRRRPGGPPPRRHARRSALIGKPRPGARHRPGPGGEGMNRLVNCSALLLAVSASCALGQAIPDRPEKLTYSPIAFQVPKAKDAKVVLKNRVPAYLVSDPTGVPLVRITVWWRGGAYMEPAGKEGLASLFGSQLAVGGTQKKDAAAVEDRLEALAATLSSSCGADERQPLPPGAGEGPGRGRRPA